MKTRWPVLATLVLILVLVAACGGSGSDEKPSVKILSPPDQYSIALGNSLAIESRSRDDRSVRQVELRVNGVPVGLIDVPEGEKSFRVVQSWLPPGPGLYQITVIAYDNKEQQSEPAAISLSVQPAAISTQMPSPTPAPTLTPTAGQVIPEPSGCSFGATFVTDVTIPDNTELAPGTEFVKTWRVRNSGTCDWAQGFQFVFVKGEQMGGPASVNVPPTLAGSTVDISVHLRAPQKVGTYRGTWRMRRPDGEEFGNRPYVQVVVPPPATQTPAVTPTVTEAPKPDLDITFILGNLELQVGQPLTLQVTLQNQGAAATELPVLVQAALWADMVLESSVPAVPAGSEQVAILHHVFDAPVDLEVLVSVDPNNEIAEEDETNNTERVPLVANPPLYVTHTITATAGLRFDLDDGITDTTELDIEWRVVDGSVGLGLLNGAGAAPLSVEVASVSYALVAGLTWEPEQLILADLNQESLFGFRTSEGRIGYARVEEVLDDAHTSARLTYLIWDWP